MIRPVVLGTAVLLVACGGNEGGPARSPRADRTTPVDPCALSTEMHMVAEGTDFDTECLTAPARTAFSIELENRDAGVGHNVVIRDEQETLFEGEVFEGPDTRTYRVQPLPGGTYRFFCIVHPFVMVGELRVV